MKLKTHSPLLVFDSDAGEMREDLSAVSSMGDYLWLASDETTSIERLSTTDGLTFRNHKSFPLIDLLRLPADGLEDVDQEIDIEGLALQDDYLWLVGSHSAKRKNLNKDPDIDSEEGIKKFAKVETEGNRYMLARIPMVLDDESNAPTLRASATNFGEGSRSLTAAQLSGDATGNELTDALCGKGPEKEDDHLERFMDIPGKENGFDIEGLAISNERVFLGLRGPVLRGWAVILELAVDSSDSKLALREIDSSGRKYRKNFLQLDGLGVRDLCFHGQDLLILAGPTMDLDGHFSIFRWRNAAATKEERLVFREQLEEICAIPCGESMDHAEGMTTISSPEESLSVLIVYDSPSPDRKLDPASVRARVFDLS